MTLKVRKRIWQMIEKQEISRETFPLVVQLNSLQTRHNAPVGAYG
jgi:hypothetical protein